VGSGVYGALLQACGNKLAVRACEHERAVDPQTNRPAKGFTGRLARTRVYVRVVVEQEL